MADESETDCGRDEEVHDEFLSFVIHKDRRRVSDLYRTMHLILE